MLTPSLDEGNVATLVVADPTTRDRRALELGESSGNRRTISREPFAAFRT
jgi:hypothetical protein